MSLLHDELHAASDLGLVGQLRDGNEAAFSELWVRHLPVARRIAATYRRSGDPEDLVNEAFEKVFAAIRRGHGPTEGFRAYLLTTMRRLAADRAEEPDEDRLDDIPAEAEAAPPLLDDGDRDLISRAFRSLPERWRAVLWYTEVEGRTPRELAGPFGMSANAVSALAYRGRQQLRLAFRQAEVDD